MFFVPCLARYKVVYNSKGGVDLFENQFACSACNSRGCWISDNYQPVSKWKCYPKKMENKL